MHVAGNGHVARGRAEEERVCAKVAEVVVGWLPNSEHGRQSRGGSGQYALYIYNDPFN
jgi:hypothetical protein